MDEIVRRAVERAVDTMRTNLGDRLTIDDLARSAMYSKFHFTRVFQRVTGVSPGRFLSAVRLSEAKQLLLTTNLSVADISHQVGYNSVGTFSSRFRNSVGVSPTTYRQLGGGPSTLPADQAAPAGAGGSVRGRVSAALHDDTPFIFVGLFPQRILEAPAVRSTLLPEPGSYVLPNVPAGTWHLIAHAPGRLPQLGTRGPITVHPQVTARLADVHLRPVGTLDPPVLMAIKRPGPELSELAS